MLYPTPLHSSCFTFNAFSHYSSLSAHLLSPSRQGMERVQGALKSGVGLEAALKTVSQQVLVDEFWLVNGAQNAVTGDDFFVDDLLDFSNGFSEVEEQSQVEELEVKERDKRKTCSVSQDKLTEPDDCITIIEGSLHGKDDFESLPCSEITLPSESLESLEWLSHFVEDSFSEYPLTGKVLPLLAENQSQSAITVQENACFSTPVQTKARTKRFRTGNRAWPVMSPSFTESSTSSSSSISSTTSFSPPNPLFVFPRQTTESLLGKPCAKKQKKKPTEVSSGGVGQPRRCSHCGVTKTPQWRAGPLGSKTLCNACGVRFKSGRLLPEYRPACSPTFSNELHSNNHRKVLEMRRKKEIVRVSDSI